MIKTELEVRQSAHREVGLNGRLLQLLVAIFIGLALLLVGSTLLRGSLPVAINQSRQPEASNSLVTPSGAVILVSWYSPPEADQHTTGKIRILNSATGDIIRTMDTGHAPDLAFSPDGRRAYLAAVEPGPEDDWSAWSDYLTAFDTSTWESLWKSKIHRELPSDWGRVLYIGGGGPATLRVSPEGDKLIVYKYAGHESWLSVVDTATGQLIAESSKLFGCNAADLSFARNGEAIFIVCYDSDDIHIMDAATLTVEQVVAIDGTIAGSATSASGKWLYVVTDGLDLTVLDLEKRTTESGISLRQDAFATAPYASQMVALSRDDHKLIVGVSTGEPEQGIDVIRIFDTGTWRMLHELSSGENALLLTQGNDASQFHFISTGLSPSGELVMHKVGFDSTLAPVGASFTLPHNEVPVRIVPVP